MPAYLTAAFDALEEHDAVLGPAADGGYVLIGLRRPAPELFAGIPWGTDAVLAGTRAALDRLGWTWAELPTLHDLDRPEDLADCPDLFGPHTTRTDAMLAWIDRLPLAVLVIAALTLGLAPFVPEPHIWEKLKLLAAGDWCGPSTSSICCSTPPPGSCWASSWGVWGGSRRL